MAKEVLVYILKYFCPVLILLAGLYCTFMLVCLLGYNQSSRMWDIEYSFALGIVGLTGTIILTNLATSGFRKLTNYLAYK